MSSALMPRPTYFGEKRVNLPQYLTNKTQIEGTKYLTNKTQIEEMKYPVQMRLRVSKTWMFSLSGHGRRKASRSSICTLGEPQAIYINEEMSFTNLSKKK